LSSVEEIVGAIDWCGGDVADPVEPKPQAQVGSNTPVQASPEPQHRKASPASIGLSERALNWLSGNPTVKLISFIFVALVSLYTAVDKILIEPAHSRAKDRELAAPEGWAEDPKVRVEFQHEATAKACGGIFGLIRLESRQPGI
jgi:hypothetical protein